MTINGSPKGRTAYASVQLAGKSIQLIVMAEEVFGRAHMVPVHTFLDGLLPKDAWFLWDMSIIPTQFRWLSPT